MLLMEVSLSQYHSVLQSFMLTNVTYEYFDYENVTYVHTCIYTHKIKEICRQTQFQKVIHAASHYSH